MKHANHKLMPQDNAVPVELTCKEDDMLSSIVDKFKSTHTPLFVYNSQGVFAGIITVEEALLKKRYTPTTRIRSRLLHPPKLTPNTPTGEALRIMFGVGLYTLPVLGDKGEVLGIVNAKDLIRDLSLEMETFERILDLIEKQPAIIIDNRESIGAAFRKFAEHNISRLLVTDNNNKISSIITKRDILSLYLTPTDRQRFSSRSNVKNYSFDEEIIKRDTEPIREYAKPLVRTFSDKLSTKDAVIILLRFPYNTMTMTDSEGKSATILTTGNVLKGISKHLAQDKNYNIIINKLPQDISKETKDQIHSELESMAAWIDKQQRLQKIHYKMNVAYSSEKRPLMFEIGIQVITDEDHYHAQSNDRDLIGTTKKTIELIKKEVHKQEGD